MSARSAPANLASGRYTVYGEIASGGMATIQYGRLVGVAGFSRAVAIKRLHPQFAKDDNFVSMLLDEARLSARIAHVNVVQTIDVLSEPGDLSIIMEYVHGESLAGLLDRIESQGARVPVRIAVSLVAGVLHGLHAAHETLGEHDEPLHIVHRDVSPENILVGSDGIARLIDFGVARAQGRSRVTPAGELKGKLAYMACEQYRGEAIDRRVDVYGASVVLWEALAGRELFKGETDAAVVGAVMNDDVKPPSAYASDVPPELDAIVLRGLSRDRTQRFETAREMALALERTVGLATQSEVSDWLTQVAGTLLAERAETLRQMRMMADPAASSSAPDAPITRRLNNTPTASDEPAPSEPVNAASQPTRASGLRRKSALRRPLILALLLLAALGVAARFFVHDAGTPGSIPARPEAAKSEPGEPPEPAASEPSHEQAEQERGAAAKPADSAPATAAPTRPGEAPAGAAVTEAAPQGNNTYDASSPRRSTRAPRGVTHAPRGATKAEEPTHEAKPESERPAPKRAKADCTNPFSVDARGIRRVKRECLE